MHLSLNFVSWESKQIYWGYVLQPHNVKAPSWLDSSIGRARQGHGLETHLSLNFFSGFYYTAAKVEYKTGMVNHILIKL